MDDDVPSLKMLCGMGFSREQAVSALETHGYDLQKALNSLLSAEGSHD
jgi:epidermal growth factor receptor substrate 15